MSTHEIKAHSLPVLPRQKLTLPFHTKFLATTMDKRFNNVLLTTLENTGSGIKAEEVEFIMVRIHEVLEPINAKYVGKMEDNAGLVFVFALRDSERLPSQAAVEEVKK